MELNIQQFRNTIVEKIAELQAMVPPPLADIETLTILLQGMPDV